VLTPGRAGAGAPRGGGRAPGLIARVYHVDATVRTDEATGRPVVAFNVGRVRDKVH
jgi:iron complex transport system ATP-binding protein